ncbi:hypothetical protein HYPSUDRAFT_208212 [Hypholoma sublateritium FD-334 SS-4]|uniref:Uncharacterized protein n=1 Tax=Hypholoma sublateritium (strain FD-334 SS-4) TaxID=945553 RepID=A0A0D2KK41_HYPSF|nr:hypothetical protein HYPSUDRAFT_208212 [Hypholoma sublateritium FD-334 SS-4]
MHETSSHWCLETDIYHDANAVHHGAVPAHSRPLSPPFPNVSPPTHTSTPKPSAATATWPTAAIRDALATEGAAPSADDGPMQQLAASVAPTQLARLAGDHYTCLDPRPPLTDTPPSVTTLPLPVVGTRPAVLTVAPHTSDAATEQLVAPQPAGARNPLTVRRRRKPARRLMHAGAMRSTPSCGTTTCTARAERGGDAAGWAFPVLPAEEALTGVKRKAGAGLNLGCVILSFDDDPKARFMGETAYTTDGELPSTLPKQARTEGGRGLAAVHTPAACCASDAGPPPQGQARPHRTPPPSPRMPPRPPMMAYCKRCCDLPGELAVYCTTTRAYLFVCSPAPRDDGGWMRTADLSPATSDGVTSFLDFTNSCQSSLSVPSEKSKKNKRPRATCAAVPAGTEVAVEQHNRAKRRDGSPEAGAGPSGSGAHESVGKSAGESQAFITVTSLSHVAVYT